MRPNILLVVLDSVRAANTSLYGHDNDTTPFLSRFAEQSTVYRQARAPSVQSIASHTSLFTGYHALEHGVYGLSDVLEPNHTIWEILQNDYGYQTGVFSSNPFITEAPNGLKEVFGTIRNHTLPYPSAKSLRTFSNEQPRTIPARIPFDRHLEFIRYSLRSDSTYRTFINALEKKYSNAASFRLRRSPNAEIYTDMFLEWMEARPSGWAACINYMDAHVKYNPSPEHDRWGGKQLRALQDETESHVWEFYGGEEPWWKLRAFESLYDGGIYQIDQAIEELINELRTREQLENTLLVITSDHGEGFGERSRVREDVRIAGHTGAGLHECLVHVPLLVKFPGQTTGKTVEDVATLTRFPTVVRQLLENSWSYTDFSPDNEPVTASSPGMNDEAKKRAHRYCERPSRLLGESMAVYRDDGKIINKEIRWGEDVGRVSIWDAQTATPVDPDGAAARLGERFRDLTERSVVTSDAGEFKEATRKKLENLGYI